MRHVIDLVYPTNASIRKFESVEVIKRDIIIAIFCYSSSRIFAWGCIVIDICRDLSSTC